MDDTSGRQGEELRQSGQRRMIRELNYVNSNEMISESRVAEVTTRAGRGLDYYRERHQMIENSSQRKKHGHLHNMLSDVQDKTNFKSREKVFVESQLKKRLLEDSSLNLMKKNLDTMNIPFGVRELFPEKTSIYDTMRHLEHDINDFMT